MSEELIARARRWFDDADRKALIGSSCNIANALIDALEASERNVATAEASAAAVGAQVREEAVKIVDGHGLPFPDAVQHGERINEMVAEMMASIRLISLPSGAEALAAVRREAAQKMLDHLAMNGWLDVEEDMTANRLIETALFPASGRTTTEGG